MQCKIDGCEFFGLEENGGRCTVCAGIHVLQGEATEADVMEIFGLTNEDLPRDAQVEQRLQRMENMPSRLFMKRLVLPTAATTDTDTHWPMIVGYDNAQTVLAIVCFVNIGPRLRPATCRRIMDCVLRVCHDDPTRIAFQKALVHLCIAPWLLERSEDFQVGLCYFGVGSGGMITRRTLERLRDAGSVRSAWRRSDAISSPPSIPSSVCRLVETMGM